MLARIDLRERPADQRRALAPGVVDPKVRDAVAAIIADVAARGDSALLELTERFDGVRLDSVVVDPEVVAAAPERIPAELRAALEFAHAQIRAYHERQLRSEADHERNGVRVHDRTVPVDAAGLYVPGGRADYPSTVLMTAVPALVAGVARVVLCAPPTSDGTPPLATLAAAAIAGVDTVVSVGGAQAIAALAFGTESIAPVDVIVGPGNAYVAEAKRQVIGQVGIDAIAGPSELVVIADTSSDARLVAADLLAQAEHGPGGSAVLVTWDAAVADAVDAELEAQLRDAPRATDARSTLASGGRCVLVTDARAAIDAANVLAPEHLQLMNADAETLVPLVRNAGAVFVGAWAPAVVGDYVAGTNHVLPTGTTARFASALCVDDFCKHIHVVRLDDTALGAVGPAAVTIARAEGLDAHARAIELRGELQGELQGEPRGDGA